MLGDRIRKIRILKGYSQEYVSDRLGMSQPNYSYIERNKSKVTFETLNQLAVIFEINISDLINFDDKAKGFNAISKDDFEDAFKLYNALIISLKEEIVYLRKKLDEKS